MDREAYRNCSSLVKIPRQSYEQFWSSHFLDYIDKELSYSKFFKKYLLPNHPCMFSRRFTEEWKCRRQWVTEDGKPNFQKLLQEFGKTNKHALLYKCLQRYSVIILNNCYCFNHRWDSSPCCKLQCEGVQCQPQTSHAFQRIYTLLEGIHLEWTLITQRMPLS